MEREARDLTRHMMDLVAKLRAAGLPVGTDQSIAFAESFRFIDPLSRSQVYHAARSTLVNQKRYLEIFEDLFEQHWLSAKVRRGQPTPRAPRHRPEDFQRTSFMSFMAEAANANAEEVEVQDRRNTASRAEQLQRKDFSTLTDGERRAVERALANMRWQFSVRRTRRQVRDRRGSALDPRESLRRAARTGGLVAQLPRKGRKEKKRPVVVLADISGSMELYSRLVLQFFHGMSQRLQTVDTFVFGTRLTRITEALTVRNVDLALEEVGREVLDFSGGTRISESLRQFNRFYAASALRRGAVVMVVSDGCEQGDPHTLGDEVRKIRDRCHRLIWLNPRLGQSRYEPKVRGMAAALPHIDDFLAVHSLESLEALRDHLAALPSRRSGHTRGAA